MSAPFSISVDIAGLMSTIGALEADTEAACRPAAQAGADVYYHEVKRNVAALGKVTGNLDRSIYQAYSKSESTPQRAVYHVSWNPRKAPHGHLVEFGHIQRYRFYRSNDGTIRPMVRPGMDGKPRPGSRATRAEKDAYYVPLDTPVQVPAKSFIRKAATKADDALDAAEREFFARIGVR